MSEQTLRLARSLIAQPDDRLVPVSHAADAFLAALIEMRGNLPAKLQRRLAPMVRDEVARMTVDGMFACEIVNCHQHRGLIYSIGLYQSLAPTVGQQGSIVRFSVGFGGGIHRNVSSLTSRAIGVLQRNAKVAGDG